MAELQRCQAKVNQLCRSTLSLLAEFLIPATDVYPSWILVADMNKMGLCLIRSLSLTSCSVVQHFNSSVLLDAFFHDDSCSSVSAHDCPLFDKTMIRFHQFLPVEVRRYFLTNMSSLRPVNCLQVHKCLTQTSVMV